MSSQSCTGQSTRCRRWLLGLAVVALWFVAAPAMASAAETCEAGFEQPRWTVDDVVQMSEMTPCALKAHMSSEEKYDSPSYNVCYASNPVPASTMPAWLAELQANEAVSTVFEQVNDLHRQSAEQGTPLSMRMSRPAMARIVDQLQQAAQIASDGPSAPMCVPGFSTDDCESIPPASALVVAHTVIGFVPASFRPDVPHPGEADEFQPALVDLRVGPSTEHRRLPERPPEA